MSRTRKVPGTLTPGLSTKSLSHDTYRAQRTDDAPIVNVITDVTLDDEVIAEREAERLLRQWLVAS